MREPSPRTSRLAIAAGLTGAIALLAAGYLAGRRAAPVPEVPVALPTPIAVPPPAVEPAVPPTLDRKALLALTAQAADAFASGRPMPDEILAAAGRRFDVLLPFGCTAPGAVESQGAMRWSFDPKASTLRVTADASTWRSDEWSDTTAADAETTFRGFWIARPWSTATTCAPFRQPQADDGAQIVLPGETVAIARPIVAGAAKNTRPFETVQRITAANFDPEQGFQLRIVGRVQAASGGSPIKCLEPRGSDQRPRCLITASFAEVSIENPKNGSVLASWPIGDDVRADEAASGSGGE